LARSRADWLYGINMTRAYTLQGRKSGYNGVLSVGRVQTPVLGLVVHRDQAIADFQPKPFYDVIADLHTESGAAFKARWLPSEACQPWQDDEGRVLDRRLAEHVVAQVSDQPATVLAASHKEGQQPPPLLYNLSSLQIDAAKRFGLSAKAVLDTCQSLYEKHQLLTYPRSDCRYLPSEHFADRERVLASIQANSHELNEPVAGADSALKSRVWNDAKVGAHHAIVPTQRRVALSQLSRAEQQVYQLVARQYVAQFYPPERYRQQRLLLQIKTGQFEAKARQQLAAGWKQLLPTASGENKALNNELPTLQQGQHCHCAGAELLEKQTTAPNAFDDASLLAAMTGIARYVSDTRLRAVLKDTDGLGTEATRAGIIELLFKRHFLARQGKKIHATATGKALIAALPEQAATPDMTARWELQLEAICQQEANYSAFMAPLTAQLQQLIAGSHQANTRALAVLPAAPKPKAFKKRGASAAKSRNPKAASKAKKTARKTPKAVKKP
jgi:DNA topoisomerase-3